MSVPDRPIDTHIPQDSSERDTSKRGGFGQFSAMYRARWAMSHPNMRRQWPGDTEALPLPLALPNAADPEPIPAVSAPGRTMPNGHELE